MLGLFAVCVAPFSMAIPTNSPAISAQLTPYTAFQCNVGLSATQAPSVLTPGACVNLSPASAAYLPAYQSYRASLDNPSAVPKDHTCTLIFYEGDSCQYTGEATNAVPVPSDPATCQPITFDLAGTVVSGGARSVRMSC